MVKNTPALALGLVSSVILLLGCHDRKKDETMTALREHINTQSRHISELTEQLESINNEIFMLEDRVDGNTARSDRPVKRSVVSKPATNTVNQTESSREHQDMTAIQTTTTQPAPIDSDAALPTVKLKPDSSSSRIPLNTDSPTTGDNIEDRNAGDAQPPQAGRTILSASGQRSKIIRKKERLDSSHKSNQSDATGIAASSVTQLKASGQTVARINDHQPRTQDRIKIASESNAANVTARISGTHRKTRRQSMTQMRIEYRHALNTLKERQVEKAIVLFKTFISSYPDQSYTDNALYWLGECYYTKRNYAKAIDHFERVIREQPSGNKVPDALLKVGYSYIKMGKLDNARVVLKSVLESFPNASVSTLARNKLSSL